MSYYLGALRLNQRQKLDVAVERALLEQCRNQDLEAFGKIVQAYQARVFGFVLRMLPTREEAEDVAQEVFLKAYQNLDKFDGRCSLRTWLFRIAHNLCVDAARKRNRGVKVNSAGADDDMDAELEVADVRWNPEEVVINEELLTVVEEAISTMSEKLRAVLNLHDREELSYEEVGQVLDIPIGTVKSRLFLARNHVQIHVKRYLEGGLA